MRSAARRAKSISRYRHQRAKPDGGHSTDDDGDLKDDDELAGLQVHVHLHGRGPSSDGDAREREPTRAELTGTLFDWHEHYDRVCQKTFEQRPTGVARLLACRGCLGTISLMAPRCVRCGTTRFSRPFAVLAVIGVVSLAALSLFASLRVLRSDPAEDLPLAVERSSRR